MRPPIQPPRAPSRTASCVALGTLAFAAAATVRLSGARDSFRRSTAHIARMSTGTQVAGGAGVVVEGGAPATAAVIFMHGLGDTAVGWSAVFPLQGLPHIRAVLPTAAQMPVSLNMGMRMPSWFDLHGLDASSQEDAAGIASAIERVEVAVAEQVAAGIPEERVVLAGFSQGGALALSAGLRTSRNIAGIAGLSAWLPLRASYPDALATGAKRRPVFLGHGDGDMVVRYQFGRESGRKLEEMGFRVRFETYGGMGHSGCDKEFKDLKAFLESVLPKTE